MTNVPTQKFPGWIWLIIIGGSLVWIIASCHPTPPAPTASVEEPAYPYDDFGAPRPYVLAIGTEEANLRDGPATSFSVVGQVEPGQEISAIGTTKDSNLGWLVIRTTEGKIAYVKQSLLQPKDAADTSKVATFPTSFDCAKATAEAEQMICQDESLAKSDVTMSNLYKSVRSKLKGSSRAELVNQQAAWMEERDQCVKEVDTKNCLSEQFQLRIITLQVTPATQPSTGTTDSSSTSA